MKTLKTVLITAVAGGMMVHAVHAIPISGSISFAGSATLDSTVATATSIDFGFAFVTTGDGDYAGVLPGTSAAFVDFTFSPFGAPVPNLWSFTFLGVTYTMTADVLTELDRNVAPPPPILNLKGTGTATITGFDPTPGTWNVSVTEGIATFSFASSATVPVPDGGTTLILLGAALSALGLVGRKLKA